MSIPSDVPQTPLPCNVRGQTLGGELIQELAEPARSHHVDNVLDAARTVAIWQGNGSLAEKHRWILNPFHQHISPKKVAIAYTFFRERCTHVALTASTLPLNAAVRHARLAGWGCYLTEIFEAGWRIATRSSWKCDMQSAVGREHRKFVFVVPSALRAKAGPRVAQYKNLLLPWVPRHPP